MRIPVTHIDDDRAPLRTPSNSRSRPVDSRISLRLVKSRLHALQLFTLQHIFDYGEPVALV